MRSVGIDIGRSSIKVVELTMSNRNYQFSGAKIYPINLNTVDNELDILTILKKVSKDFNTENARVVTSIRQNYVSVRKVLFPFKERQKILKSLSFEIEDDLPYDIDKCICDARILKLTEGGAEVLAMACPTEEIDKTLEIFRRSGIDPDIITPEYAAFSNLYQPRWYLSPTEALSQEENEVTSQEKLVVHFGHARSFAAIQKGSNLLWGRSLRWGAELIASEIARTFQVPMSEALKMMPTKAFILLSQMSATSEQKRMSDTVTHAIKPLVHSLRMTQMMMKTEFGLDAKSVELSGGAAHVKNIGPYLTQALELPVNVANPLEFYDPAKVRSLLPHKDTCHVAFGLAIEGLKRPVNPPVNFRQLHLAKKNLTFEKTWEKWGYTAKLLAIAWVLFLVAGMVRESIAIDLEEQSNDVLQSQARKVAGIQRNITASKIRKYIKVQKKNAELVKLYEKVNNIISPIEILQNISSIMPANNKNPNYNIRFFQVKNNKMSIHGVSDNNKAIKKIEIALKSIASDGKIKPTPSVIPNETGKVKFSYQLKVKRKN